MIIKKAITFLFFAHVTMLYAQPSIPELQYSAYLNNDKSFALWEQAIAICKTALQKKPGNDSLRYNLAQAQFGLMNATLRTKDEDKFDDYYDETVELADELTNRNKKWAEPFALQSAIYHTKMAYSPMQGMVLGSKSASLIARAKQLNPASPFVWKVYANSKFFTPETFGGNVDEAIEAYKRSIQLYEATPTLIKNNWHYLDALAFLGQAYVKKERKADATAIFEKALKAEPGFLWVKNVLLPKAQASK